MCILLRLICGKFGISNFLKLQKNLGGGLAGHHNDVIMVFFDVLYHPP